MSDTLTRTGIVTPSADKSDPVHPVADIRAVALWAEQFGMIVLPADTYVNIPAAAKYGRVFHPTDAGREGEFYFDNGSAWRRVSPTPPTDPIAATPGLRTLGAGAQQAASGAHTHGAPPGTVWYPHSTVANVFSAGAHTLTAPTPSPVILGGSTVLAALGTSAPLISADGGVTWTQTGVYPATTTGWGGYSYGNSLFVGCQRGTSYGNVATNPGTTSTAWTSRAMPATQYWMCTAFNGTTFVAVGQAAGGAATTQAASSVNGTAWTSRTMATSATWDSVCWDGTKFVALPADAAACNVSVDGITWSATSVGTMPGSPLGNLATDGAGTCVVGYAAGYMLSTDHGTTWTSRAIGGSVNGYHCYYVNGYWFFIDYSATNSATMMHVCATADVGKVPTPIVAAQPSYSGGLAQGTAWVVYTGAYTLAGTRSGVLRA